MDTKSPSPWTEASQDPGLLKQAQDGDLSALLRLFNTHRLSLWRACVVITQVRDEAERLFQETLARATRELSDAPKQQPLLPWLVGLARDLDSARARGPLERATPGERRPNGKPWDAGVRNALDFDLEQRALLGFSMLHWDDQWMLALRILEGLSHADIARVTGQPVSIVAERLALARGYVDQVCAAKDRAA